MANRPCPRCKSLKPEASFRADSKSRNCSSCRKASMARHLRNYYASLPPDKRHTLGHKKRAERAGVAHEPYSRTAIMSRWDNRCAYCSDPATHLDHVVPISRGGPDAEHNMLPACAPCNLSKGARTLAEWAETFGPLEVPPF